MAIFFLPAFNGEGNKINKKHNNNYVFHIIKPPLLLYICSGVVLLPLDIIKGITEFHVMKK